MSYTHSVLFCFVVVFLYFWWWGGGGWGIGGEARRGWDRMLVGFQ